METMVVVNGMTAHRANVIFARTGSAAMGVVKAQMIAQGEVEEWRGTLPLQEAEYRRDS